MGWSNIKSCNPKILELKRVSNYVINELSNKSSNVFTYHNSIFQIKFYNFMKKIQKKYKISPNEVLCFLIKNPIYIEKIYKQDLDTLQSLLIQSSNNEERKIISFVTLYYDYYYRFGSIFKALLKTIHYPFDKFNLAFVKKIFNMYPFLTKKEHLDNVIEKIKEKGYAHYVTINGIKEKY